MSPKMVAALKDARAAGDQGLGWTPGGWQMPHDPFSIGVYHNAVVISRLMFDRGFLRAEGPKSSYNQRRIITDAGLAWLTENGL